MATTQSGYVVIEEYGSPLLVSNPVVPGTDGVKILGGLRAGDPATVLLYAASRWHAEVEPLVQSQGQWGYDKRDIRGGSGWSNHAGGVAEDLNAAIHPQGAETMNEAKKNQVRRIISDINGLAGQTVLDWGGEWNGSTKDEMHIQLTSGVSEAALHIAAQKIRGEIPLPPVPEPPDPEEDDELTDDDKKWISAEIAKQIKAVPDAVWRRKITGPGTGATGLPADEVVRRTGRATGALPDAK